MTHDELLAKIDKIKPLNSPAWDMQNALRAVVELHKPDIPSYCFEDTRCCDDECVTCSLVYPCPTIQAIEMHLE